MPCVDDKHSEPAPPDRGGGSAVDSPEAGPPLLVPIDCAGRPAVAVVDQIRAVAKERLQQRVGAVSSAHLKAVEDALRQILEL